VQLAPAEEIHYVGDFADVVTAPNDPIFAFHHANVDRHFEMWRENVLGPGGLGLSDSDSDSNSNGNSNSNSNSILLNYQDAANGLADGTRMQDILNR
jgi:hypothetical protein